jgi:basic membrane protein A
MAHRMARPLVAGLVIASAVAAAGCGSSGNSASSTASSTSAASTTPASSKSLSIALMTPAQRNDGGLTQYSLVGVNDAVKAIPGSKLSSVVDNVTDPQKQIQTLRTLAQNNDVVIADSATLNQAVDTVAPSYPSKRFILVAGLTKNAHDNVTSLNPQPGYDAALIGAIAALRTKTKKLGMISGVQVPASEAWGFGMRQGAGLVDKSATVATTFTGDYNDVGKAKQAAQAMIANGVDQIIADLDSGSEGIYQAAASAKGKKVEVYQVFGANCAASPTVVGAGVISWASIVKEALTSYASRTLKPGASYYTLKSKDALNFQWCDGKSTSAEVKLVGDTTQKFVSGQATPAKGVTDPNPGYEVVEK